MAARESLVKAATETLVPQAGDRQRWWQQITEYSLIVIFVIMFAVMSLTVDHFFSIENILGLALSVSQIGMVSCTMMFCLASRDFDLSIGSTVAFAGVLCAMIINATGSIALGIGVSLVAGAVIGGINGFVIAKLKINALITTLATMEIVRGLAFIASHGQAVGVSDMVGNREKGACSGAGGMPASLARHSRQSWVMRGALVGHS